MTIFMCLKECALQLHQTGRCMTVTCGSWMRFSRQFITNQRVCTWQSVWNVRWRIFSPALLMDSDQGMGMPLLIKQLPRVQAEAVAIWQSHGCQGCKAFGWNEPKVLQPSFAQYYFRKACCQRWNDQLFVYLYIFIFFVDILHDLMLFVVHAQAFSIRNIDRLVVGAQKAICFPKYITWSKTILAFCCPYTSLF